MKSKHARYCRLKQQELKTAKKVLKNITEGCDVSCGKGEPKQQTLCKDDCDKMITTFKKNLEHEKTEIINKGCII